MSFAWLRRAMVAVIGFTVLLIGVAMVVLPGPAVIVIHLRDRSAYTTLCAGQIGLAYKCGIDLFGNKNVADSKPWQRIQSFILSNRQSNYRTGGERKLCRQQLSRMARAPDSNSLI